MDMGVQVKDQHAKLQQRESDFDDLHDELKKTKQHESELNSKLKDAIESATLLREAVDDLQNTVRIHKKEKANFEKERSDLIESLQNQHKEQLDATIVYHQAEMTKKVDELEHAVKEKTALVEEVDSIKKELLEMREKETQVMTMHEDELSRRKSEYSKEIQKNKDELETKLKSVEESFAKLSQQHGEQEEAHQQKVRDLCDQHSSAIDELHAKLAEAETVNECIYNEGKTTTDNYETQISELKSQLEKATRDQSEAMASAQDTSLKLVEAERLQEQLRSEIEALHNTNKRRDHVMDRATDVLELADDFDNNDTKTNDEMLQSQYEQAKSTIEGLQTTLSAHEKKSSEQHQKLESLLRSRESELSSVNASYDQLAAKLVDAEEKMKDAESRETELRMKLDTQRLELTSLRQKSHVESISVSHKVSPEVRKSTSPQSESEARLSSDENVCNTKVCKTGKSVSSKKNVIIESSEANQQQQGNKPETKKRARKPLGEVQQNEVEARPGRAKVAKKATASIDAHNNSSDSNNNNKPATRYSLRSRANNVATYAT